MFGGPYYLGSDYLFSLFTLYLNPLSFTSRKASVTRLVADRLQLSNVRSYLAGIELSSPLPLPSTTVTLANKPGREAS